MKVLALDTSAKAAGCAVYKDGALLAESFLNAGLTHSQTIMPMLDSMLTRASLDISEIGLFAVSVGPGSFTGLRIGIAAVKGMAMAGNIPCSAVSTLEALAFNLTSFNGIIAPVMDARRAQVYTALFKTEGGALSRLSPDEAISIDELALKLEAGTEPVILVGDGAVLCYERLNERFGSRLLLAPENLRHQRAASVAAVAAEMPESQYKTAEELEPVYLRLPQAERERLAAMNNEQLTDNR